MNGAVLLIFLFAFTIHNLEEGIWLTRQQSSEKSKMKMHKTVTQDEFLFGLFWVTSLAYLITALYIFYPDVGLFKYSYFGFVGAMILNILFPHLISTLIERYYSPGLFTGLIVIIPINSLIVKTAIELGTITISQFIISTLAVGVSLLLSIPISFKIGKQLITF
ncbi:HXXEE domain-containing protein [Pueribacillus theae]|uniref:HXXEE domain-containing protein n=1 Tax=Pueribacillus theae TaxID=2171751 RepID=A0A2U1K2U8_9BACI|nr:HXXEE domain-containing protein [Pueribacillus theae]PWA11847.1 HXXEE domain-containing protein [Pueribacillus theae]